MTEAIATPGDRNLPLWQKIWRFPLVSLLAALIAIVVPMVAISVSIRQLPLGGLSENVVMPVILVVATMVAIVMYKLVVSLLGEQPRDELPFDSRARDGLRGTFYAALLMSIIVGIVALLGGYDIVGMGGSTSWPMLLFGAGLQAAFVEEIIARGIIFRFLEEFGGSWFALAVSSGIFGFAHAMNENATTFSSLAIALEAGVLLGGAYMLTRNLWLAIGLHFGWNVTQGYLWDVPVSGAAVDGLVEAQARGPELISGGAFGVEASIVALVLATGIGAWVVYLAVRRGNVVRPWWVRRRLAKEEAAA